MRSATTSAGSLARGRARIRSTADGGGPPRNGVGTPRRTCRRSSTGSRSAGPVDVTRAVLARIETKAGHGAGKPTTKIIEEISDQWAFLVKNLGVGK